MPYDRMPTCLATPAQPKVVPTPRRRAASGTETSNGVSRGSRRRCHGDPVLFGVCIALFPPYVDHQSADDTRRMTDVKSVRDTFTLHQAGLAKVGGNLWNAKPRDA